MSDTMMDPVVQLRLLLGEKVPAGKEDTDTFFSNAELTALLAAYNGSINAATYIGWTMKLADAAKYVDIAESGSERKLSQKYKNALLMAKHWQGVFEKELADAALATRVVGRVARILADNNVPKVLVNEFIGPQDATSIRQYPTHRMPSVLG